MMEPARRTRVLISGGARGDFVTLLNISGKIHADWPFDCLLCLGETLSRTITPGGKELFDLLAAFPTPVCFIDSSELAGPFMHVERKGCDVCKHFSFLGRAGHKKIGDLSVAFISGRDINGYTPRDRKIVDPERTFTGNKFTLNDTEGLAVDCNKSRQGILLTCTAPSRLEREVSLSPETQGLYNNLSNKTFKLSVVMSPQYVFGSGGANYVYKTPVKSKLGDYTRIVVLADLCRGGVGEHSFFGVEAGHDGEVREAGYEAIRAVTGKWGNDRAAGSMLDRLADYVNKLTKPGHTLAPTSKIPAVINADNCVLMLARSPVTELHLVCVPKMTVAEFASLGQSTKDALFAELGALVQNVAAYLGKQGFGYIMYVYCPARSKDMSQLRFPLPIEIVGVPALFCPRIAPTYSALIAPHTSSVLGSSLAKLPAALAAVYSPGPGMLYLEFSAPLQAFGADSKLTLVDERFPFSFCRDLVCDLLDLRRRARVQDAVAPEAEYTSITEAIQRNYAELMFPRPPAAVPTALTVKGK